MLTTLTRVEGKCFTIIDARMFQDCYLIVQLLDLVDQVAALGLASRDFGYEILLALALLEEILAFFKLQFLQCPQRLFNLHLQRKPRQ